MISSRAPAGLIATTSGSSGQPVAVMRGHLSWAYAHANTIRGWRWHGIDVGDRYAYFWGLPLDEKTRRQGLQKDLFFNRVRLSAFGIDRNTAADFYRRLLRHPARWAFGYPSAMTAFTEEVAAAGLDGRRLRWRAAVTSAEVLRDHQRDRIADVFGCPVVDSYGCAEIGGAGFECVHRSMHVPTEIVVLDLVPTEDGRREILLTDLHNLHQPVIRYQVGDFVATPMTTGCPCGRQLPVLPRIEGRAGDVLVLPDGRRVNGLLPYYVFRPYAKSGFVREYQFVQFPSGRIELRLIPGAAWNPDLLGKLRAEMLETLGFDPEIRAVERIQRMGRAKHRDFVRAADLGESE
jgi:phenylacetate-CoA ligase